MEKKIITCIECPIGCTIEAYMEKYNVKDIKELIVLFYALL